ncbi:MAG: DUF3488 and DUF4129 domain-containing transglutaminase family protein [Pseudomonadota bacterium]
MIGVLSRTISVRDQRSRRLGEAPDTATLWWLVGALAVVLLPHIERTPWWYLPLFALAVAERMSHEYMRRPPLPGVLRLLVTLAAVAGIAMQYGTILGRQAGIAMLCVMIALKLTEAYRRRDVYFLVSLGYFVAVTQFLFSQSVYLVAYIVVAVVLITGALIVHEVQPSRASGSRVGAQTWLDTVKAVGVMVLQALPIMIALFVLFPRLNTPLWGMPEDALDAKTGVSGEMSPGSMVDLFIDDSPAFRANFEGPVPRTDQLYWRGPVLWNFDGRTWTRPIRSLRYAAEIDATRVDQPLRYRIALEPSERFWLFGLDVPMRIVDSEARMQQDHTLYRQRPIIELFAYEVVSDPDYVMDPELSPLARSAALSLPDGFNPRTAELAAEWRSEIGNDDAAIVRRALAFFNRENFVYSFEPPPLGRDTADDFLFETRNGFCEHYSSAFVILMRSAGIPTRVVTGYQGGWHNEGANYVLVRQSDAHAWAEVWLEGRGWTRVDPTAAVAPERIQAGAREILGGRNALDADWLRSLRNQFDAIHNLWNNWVLEFNRERQDSLLERLTGGGDSTRTAVIALTILVSIIMGLITRMVLRGEWLGGLDAPAREYAKFCRKLGRGGVPRAPSEGPRDLARRAMLALPQQARGINEITSLYVDLRYGGATNPELLRRLRQAVRQFPRRPRRTTTGLAGAS